MISQSTAGESLVSLKPAAKTELPAEPAVATNIWVDKPLPSV
jgi:hypothetical protein